MADEVTHEEGEQDEVRDETHGSTEGHEDSRWDDPPDEDAELEEWKAYARKWEQRAKENRDALLTKGQSGRGRESRELKRVRQEAEELKAKLAEREDADKSEQEKAVEAAARTAREEAKSESEKERRADKLEMAVTKLGAVRGVKVGDGDDERVVKFADPDDVQMWLEKQIERGEIDADAIYADGKVNEEALADELARLAGLKPGWLAGAQKGNGRPAGSADGGRGSPASSDTDVEATLQKIQRRRSGAAA